MRTGRVEAFSDGVFAIAITLLVLDIRVPLVHGDSGLWPGLRAEWPTFAAYLTSFLIIGIMWVNHHSMFGQIVRIDRALLFLNLFLLLWTALLPFPTSLVAQYVDTGGRDAAVAEAVYSANLTLCAIAFSLMWAYAVRGGRLIAHAFPAREERRVIWRFSVGVLLYGATILLSFLSPMAALAVQFGLALYYLFEQITTHDDAVVAT